MKQFRWLTDGVDRQAANVDSTVLTDKLEIYTFILRWCGGYRCFCFTKIRKLSSSRRCRSPPFPSALVSRRFWFVLSIVISAALILLRHSEIRFCSVLQCGFCCVAVWFLLHYVCIQHSPRQHCKIRFSDGAVPHVSNLSNGIPISDSIPISHSRPTSHRMPTSHRIPTYLWHTDAKMFSWYKYVYIRTLWCLHVCVYHVYT